MKLFFTLFLTISSLTLVTESFSQQIAFPGAEGTGRFASGGRGTPTVPTTVYAVTRLDDGTDNDIGTFRWAVRNNSGVAHRTVIFRISGTIRLTTPLTTRANTTIAGQTAPGDGICIADQPVTIGGDNIIIRYLRFRLGDRYQAGKNPPGHDDALTSLGRKHVIIDHCSFSWSNDECLSVYRGDSTTLQWNMIYEPLDYSYHNEGSGVENHGYGGIWGGRRVSFHHNLIAHVRGRAPRFEGSRNLPNSTTPVVGSENADFRNNLIYNWADYNVNGGEGGNYNVVDNYYKYGPSTPNTTTSQVNRRNMVINPSRQTSPALPYGKFYLTGNYVDSLPGIPSFVTNNNWRGAAMSGGSLNDTNQSKVNAPFDTIAPFPTTHTAVEAYELVLQNAGATLPKRDTLDERITNNVRNRTGRIINMQGGYERGTPFEQTLSAWPTLNSAPAPADSDNDGMPNEWETSNGLNPTDPADRNVRGSDGYTMLEKYLNYIVEQAALPLRLVSFKGSVIQKQVQLTWTTTNELNTRNFSVERSVDGRTYSSIGTVEATNVGNTTNYSFTDNEPSNSRTYYRLRMNDRDDKFTYSPILSFNAIAKGVLRINPNPVRDNITLSHTVASSAAQVLVYSQDGKLNLSYKIGAGAIQTSFSVGELAPGIYSLVFINNNEKTVQKFVKN